MKGSGGRGGRGGGESEGGRGKEEWTGDRRKDWERKKKYKLPGEGGKIVGGGKERKRLKRKIDWKKVRIRERGGGREMDGRGR